MRKPRPRKTDMVCIRLYVDIHCEVDDKQAAVYITTKVKEETREGQKDLHRGRKNSYE